VSCAVPVQVLVLALMAKHEPVNSHFTATVRWLVKAQFRLTAYTCAILGSDIRRAARGNRLTDESVEQSTQPSPVRRRLILVRGVVQGVGFRPFVYRLAHEEGLAGSIGNHTDGVTIAVEGAPLRLDAFIARLHSEIPPLARVDSVLVSEMPIVGDVGFHIVSSEILGRVSTGIPADAATCADCLRELNDPDDRRYRYPFINCTNCGPRYTITRSIPYDRPQTSMAQFKMCAACQAEYDDPANRRFHAQPNACWDCGPRVWMKTASGEKQSFDDPVSECITRLAAGQIAAIKGIGGFHLSVNAFNESAVMRLRKRKHRYGKPLAIMCRDVEAARAFCVLTDEEMALLQTPARPIVLARKAVDSAIANGVAPGIPWLGIFLPYAPLQHLLFQSGQLQALVMTSANLSEEPIAIENHEAIERLSNIADLFLMHDRAILQRCDDSVVAMVDGAPQLMRRARGYVPLAVALPFDAPPLVAAGGQLKSALALARGPFVYQSQHLGDLDNVKAMDFFKEALVHLMHTFEIKPEAVACDMHPAYVSTQWANECALERSLRLISVQHHHAHVAGCMAEHRLLDQVIGIALDGTGYGTDGNIWGGEVLLCTLRAFDRFAHLEYVHMPGGDAAVKQPWRMALAHLRAAGLAGSIAKAAEILNAREADVRVLCRMMDRGLHAPLTSSCGRLFDAVGALLLHRHEVDYEAQAAVELEGIALDEPDGQCGYSMNVHAGNWALREPTRLSAAPLWRELLSDLHRGASIPAISARFHAGVAESFVKAAVLARSATGIQQVVLSGGCMHNRRLARLLRNMLEFEGFEVFQHLQVSPGDGGLSYGQAAIAAALLTPP
jgi:hydrogenase maturation protein HypF